MRITVFYLTHADEFSMSSVGLNPILGFGFIIFGGILGSTALL